MPPPGAASERTTQCGLPAYPALVSAGLTKEGNSAVDSARPLRFNRPWFVEIITAFLTKAVLAAWSTHRPTSAIARIRHHSMRTVTRHADHGITNALIV